jgi:hypothetical protein
VVEGVAAVWANAEEANMPAIRSATNFFILYAFEVSERDNKEQQ